MMTTEYIEYWLVRRTNFIRESQYLMIGLDGEIETTENPKRAMRWFTEEGAKAFAERLGWPWKVVRVKFNANELVG
jgi:hypothetical protein